MARYLELLEGCPGLRLANGAEAVAAMGGEEMLPGHSWFLYTAQVTKEAKVNRDQLLEALTERGISYAVNWTPLHLHPYYRGLGYEPGDFPRAEAGYQGLLCLPFFVDITDEQMVYVAENMRDILGGGN